MLGFPRARAGGAASFSSWDLGGVTFALSTQQVWKMPWELQAGQQQPPATGSCQRLGGQAQQWHEDRLSTRHSYGTGSSFGGQREKQAQVEHWKLQRFLMIQ